jgi:predicted dehydrogenase
VDVPELAARGDRDEADRWRAARRLLRAQLGLAGGPLRVALATDGRVQDTGARLADAGADLVGLLAPEPLESLAWAAAAGARRAYPDLRSLLADEVEAVCLDLDLPAGLALARTVAHAGLDLLLARVDTLGDSAALRTLVEAAQVEEVAVTAALRSRAWLSVSAARNLLGPLGALRQMTVVGWPLGRGARLELVDMVRRLCGDVLAVCAAPGAMPAADLRPGEPVTLALLTGSGATVLVAEKLGADLADAGVTVVGTDGRLMFGSDFLRRQDARGVAASSLPNREEAPSPFDVALRGLVDGDLSAGFAANGSDGVDSSERRNGAAATVGELLAAARVLDVATASFEAGRWLEI